METKNYEKLGIMVHETGNLDTAFTVERTDKISFMPRLKNFFDLNEFRRVYRILVREKPDILMAFNNSTITGPIILVYKIRFAFNRKTRSILKLDSDGSEFMHMKSSRKKLVTFYFSILGMLFDRIIVESSCGYDAFHNIPVFGKKLGIVQNSISEVYRNRHVQNKREKTIITVSRIVRDKNIALLIEAFAGNANNFPEWNLKIIGPINDMEYYKSMNNTIIKYGLQKRIEFTGPLNLSRLIGVYSKSSIFCLFSTYESFAIARLEAIAMGMYVISSEAGCASDYLKYGIHVVSIDDLETSKEEIKKAIISIEKNGSDFSLKEIPSYRALAEKIIKNDF
jgi:glycosyltransferase involved in cell wall biosynthesis